MHAIKSVSLTLLATFLLPCTSFADYRPGRVRVDARAEMQARSGRGDLRKIRQAVVTQEVTDGKGITHYRLEAEGQAIRFAVQEIRSEGCGEVRLAQATDGSGLLLQLQDSSADNCRRPDVAPWVLELSSANGAHGLLLVGVPEFFLLTQGSPR